MIKLKSYIFHIERNGILLAIKLVNAASLFLAFGVINAVFPNDKITFKGVLK